MEFRILGPLEVWSDGRRIPVTAAKQRTLLAALLLRADRVVSADELIDCLWGERPPATARKTLQNYVRRIRTILQSCTGDATPPVLLTQSPGYLLRLGNAELDLYRFQRLVDGARQAAAGGDARGAAERLRQALSLWRGPALADVADEALLRTEAGWLEERRLAALETRIDMELDLGQLAGLVAELEALVTLHPLRERFRGQLMLALYRSGRQIDALYAYGDARRMLTEEFGVEPGPQLQRLERAILAADSSLEVPAGATPAQLPADVAGFTGRARQLEKLDRLLKPGAGTTPVVATAIAGTAGVGKSALAIHAAHRLTERFGDGQLYVNLQGATVGLRPLEPLEVLGRLLRALGVDSGEIPNDVDEAAARFRSQVAGRRLLIVLDNARDAMQVGLLLPGSPSCGVLITSREVLASLEGAQPMQLDLLPQQEALALLGRIVGQERIAAQPQAAAEVVRWCGRLPLALRIAGARLAARPGWPVRALAERLTDATRRLEELRVGELAVRASFQVSVQVLEQSHDPLDRLAAQAFGLLSVPDGPDLDVAAAARLLDRPEPTAQALLERLVDAQLLESPHLGRYRFHDLLRLYAREHAAATYPEPERLAALERLFGFYTATAWHTFALLRPCDHRLTTADPTLASGGRTFPDAAAALEWLEAERPNLLAAIGQTATIAPAIPAKLGTQLTRALFAFFDVHSHWTDWVQSNQTALELAGRTADRTGQAHSHNDLACASWRLGRYQEAIDHQQQALTLFQKLDDHRGHAASLNNLGTFLERLGRYQEAIGQLHQAFVLFRELGDRYGQANSLTNLGFAYGRLGRYPEAIDHLQQAFTLRRELGDRYGQANSLGNLGLVYWRWRRYSEALDHQQQALTLRRELGDRHGQARSLGNLGGIYERLGRYPEALDHQQQALTLFRELGDRYGQAEALRDLGDALLGAGRLGQAQKVWRAALGICEALRVPEVDEIRKRLAALRPDAVKPV